MLTLRRPQHEARVEIMPLIDVIFLLLTFFIYAMVLMVRVDLMPMKLESFASAEAGRPAPVATISVMRDGGIYLDRRPTALDELPDAVASAVEADPQTKVFIVLEEGRGTVDRGPILTAIIDRMREQRVDVSLVGKRE